MQQQAALPLRCLGLKEPPVWPGERLADGLGISSIVLVPLDVWLLRIFLPSLLLRAETVNKGCDPACSPSQDRNRTTTMGMSCRIACWDAVPAGALLRTTRYTVQCSDLRADAVVEV
jgi:hypothetical protein